MIRALLFDMDGLIFDTETMHKTCWLNAAAEQNLTIDEHFYQTFIGVQTAECEDKLLDYFTDKLDLPRFQQVRDEQLATYREKRIEFKAGFIPLFNCLKKYNLSCALVTSSERFEVEHYFQSTSYLEQFDTVVTAEDIQYGKPNPDCYLLASKNLALAPRHCLVLEDSNSGMKSGLDAGCLTAMIPDLLQPSKEIEMRANFIFESLNDVIALIETTSIEKRAFA